MILKSCDLIPLIDIPDFSTKFQFRMIRVRCIKPLSRINRMEDKVLLRWLNPVVKKKLLRNKPFQLRSVTFNVSPVTFGRGIYSTSITTYYIAILKLCLN